MHPRFIFIMQLVKNIFQGFIFANNPDMSFGCSIVVITTAQQRSTKDELRFCESLNPLHSKSEVCDVENTLFVVNYSTKTIHHHDHHYHILRILYVICSINCWCDLEFSDCSIRWFRFYILLYTLKVVICFSGNYFLVRFSNPWDLEMDFFQEIRWKELEMFW